VIPRRNIVGRRRERFHSQLSPCFVCPLFLRPLEPRRSAASCRGPGRTHEPWTYLEPKEQEALLESESIPEAVRLLIAFAVGTGMRQGEIWNLATRDVCMSENQVIVRYGSRGRSTKGKRIRYVPLLGSRRTTTSPRPTRSPNSRSSAARCELDAHPVIRAARSDGASLGA
jgi:integrase